MSGYEITKQDIAAVLRWLSLNYPESAEDYAKAMLEQMKTKYRKLGVSDPDALETIYKEFLEKN